MLEMVEQHIPVSLRTASKAPAGANLVQVNTSVL